MKSNNGALIEGNYFHLCEGVQFVVLFIIAILLQHEQEHACAHDFFCLQMGKIKLKDRTHNQRKWYLHQSRQKNKVEAGLTNVVQLQIPSASDTLCVVLRSPMKDTAPSVSEQPPNEERKEDCKGEEDTHIITCLW